jgi:hypothetical protein
VRLARARTSERPRPFVACAGPRRVSLGRIALPPSVMARLPPPSIPSVVTVHTLTGVEAIFVPTTNAVIWRRPPSAALEAELAPLVARAGFGLRMMVDVDDAGRARLERVLDEAPTLAAETWGLVELLSTITGAERVGVRLARLDRAMCPRFHVDRVVLRAVVTFAGPGTQLVDVRHVDRARLAEVERPDADALSPDAAVLEAAVGDVVWLKGEAWAGNEGRGAIHRSPAVPEGSTRLVLTLDPIFGG